MKKSFVSSLVGMNVSDAEKAVYLEGLEFMTLTENEAAAAIAMPKTVVMWHSDNKVIAAEAGDPFELEHD